MRSLRRAFTLIELLAAIAIIAALTAVGVFMFIQVSAWARTTADQHALATLNDALHRYKTQGGGSTALTAGSDISALLGRMRSGVTWGGQGHQFIQAGYTYPARSLSAMGNAAQYAFYRAGTYSEQTPSSSTPTNEAPYGQNVAYVQCTAGGSWGIGANSSSGYFAVQDSTGTTTIETDGASVAFGPEITSFALWPCMGLADATIDTSATFVLDLTQSSNYDANNVTDINVQGASGLTTLKLGECPMTSINLSGLSQLTTFLTIGGYLTSVNVSGCTNLQDVAIENQQLSSGALNAIYTALPDRNSTSDGSILVGGNPGTSTDSPSIATGKNWTVADS